MTRGLAVLWAATLALPVGCTPARAGSLDQRPPSSPRTLVRGCGGTTPQGKEIVKPDARLTELLQRVEDLNVGLTTRIDALGDRLAAVEDNLNVIRSLPGDRLPIDPQFVAERLGLTPAQGRVAVALAEGKTVHDIAEETRRMEGTVRGMLKEINRRLDISTQVQLVRLVLLPPHATTVRRSPDAETPVPAVSSPRPAPAKVGTGCAQ